MRFLLRVYPSPEYARLVAIVSLDRAQRDALLRQRVVLSALSLYEKTLTALTFQSTAVAVYSLSLLETQLIAALDQMSVVEDPELVNSVLSRYFIRTKDARSSVSMQGLQWQAWTLGKTHELYADVLPWKLLEEPQA